MISHFRRQELAYRCRDQPTLFEGKVEVDEDGTFILVYTEKGRVRIPLQVISRNLAPARLLTQCLCASSFERHPP